MVIDTLVEGLLDQAVARRLIRFCGHQPGTGYGTRGIVFLRDSIKKYAAASRHSAPILALADFMDTGLACAPEIVSAWLPESPHRMLLRVVIREVESWLLADRAGIAAYLGVAVNHVSSLPEGLPDPKLSLVSLARRSRRRDIKTGLVPPPGVSSRVGPDYVSQLEQFVNTTWDVDAAQRSALSLTRCIARLQELSTTP